MKLRNKISFTNCVEGQNSIFFELGNKFLMYEKLSNTLHLGNLDEIEKLHKQIEDVHYNPVFEGITLKNKSAEKLENLLLNVTEKCDLKCDYCIYSGDYEGERVNAGKDMGFDTARKAIDYFIQRSNNSNPLVGFYGGEPLNNFELIKEIIEYAKKQHPNNNIVFSLTTNFVNVSEHLEFLVKNEVYANISLDGPREMHDKHRRTKSGKPTFDKILNNLQIVESINPGYVKNHFGINGTYKDTQDFPRMVNYFIEQDKNFMGVRIGNAEKKGLKQKEEEPSIMQHVLDYAETYADSILSGEKPPSVLRRLFDDGMKGVYVRSNKKLPPTLPLEGACSPGERKLFVDTEGALFMCEKFGKKAPIGHVNNGISKESVIKTIDDFTEIRNQYCTNGCWAQRLCTPCIQSAKDYSCNISVNGLAESCSGFKTQVVLGISLYSLITKENPDRLISYFKE